MKTTPLKRSKELIPLSRDHHDGLLLCWKIRTGINRNIETTRITAYLLDFFTNDLKEHFRLEEEHIFTLLPKNDSMRLTAERQHYILNDLVEKMQYDRIASESTLRTFADTLDEHIRFEERKLFPYIEEYVDPHALTVAGAKIIEPKKQSLKWNDEFWRGNI